MAASPAPKSSGSLASSASASAHSSHQKTAPVAQRGPSSYSSDDPIVPVETLVEHLLAAKRSLSSMTLVLRANDITQQARDAHEESVVLNAQTEFIRRAVLDQVRLLLRVRKGLLHSYDGAKREFGQIVRTMDMADEKLTRTMNMLRNTTVESAFRPPGEEPRSLLDFVDEKSVHAMRDALKESIGELQAAQQSFDGDLLRFETDLRALSKILTPPATSSPSDSTNMTASSPSPHEPIPYILTSLTEHSHIMAELLSSLTRHFDLCVTAVRATEGGSELARLKAAETNITKKTSSPSTSSSSIHADKHPKKSPTDVSTTSESVSISNVLAAHETSPSALPPLTLTDRTEMLKIVVADSEEVDEVVAELNDRLDAMESGFSHLLDSHLARARDANEACVSAYRLLVDLSAAGPGGGNTSNPKDNISTNSGGNDSSNAGAGVAGDAPVSTIATTAARLGGYVQAESEFMSRWEAEKEVVSERLAEMDELRKFYEGYANAYDGLIVEAERRRAVDERIRAVWKKAAEAVQKIVAGDEIEREGFRGECGEFLPTDLWGDMARGVARWEVGAVGGGGGGGGRGVSEGEALRGDGVEGFVWDGSGDDGVVALERSVVQAARERLKGRVAVGR